MTNVHNDDVGMLARRLLHGAKGIELFHKVGCQPMKVPAFTNEYNIMTSLEKDGFVYHDSGDWFLTQSGLRIWNVLFDAYDPGKPLTRPRPD